MIVVQDTVILRLLHLGSSSTTGRLRLEGDGLACRVDLDYVRAAALGWQARQRRRVTDVDLPEAVHNNEMQILQLEGFRDCDVQSALEYRRKAERFVVELAQEVSHQ
jgi:hypothetical protein